MHKKQHVSFLSELREALESVMAAKLYMAI